LGAAVAGLLYEFLYLRPAASEQTGPPETGVLEPGISSDPAAS
jgi:hypothetical protein